MNPFKQLVISKGGSISEFSSPRDMLHCAKKSHVKFELFSRNMVLILN